MRAGCGASRRDSRSTLSMMALMRWALLRMISVIRNSSGPSPLASPSSCAAWLIAPTGLRISWAMLAVSRPSAASFDCCTRAASAPVSSRKIRSGAGSAAPSGAKCALMMRTPSAALKVPGVLSSARGSDTPRHMVSRYSRRGETSPSSAPGTATVSPSISAADSLISRMRSLGSTTRMLSRRRCTMYCDNCAMLARSTSWRRTCASLSRRRFAIGQADAATRKTTAPMTPASG